MDTQRETASSLSHIYIWTGRLMMLSPGLRNRPHRHLATSILVGLDRPFELGVDTRRGHYSGVIVAPNARQSLDSRGGAMLILHVDPDLAEFRRIAGRVAQIPFWPIPETTLAPFAPRLQALRTNPPDCAQADALFQDLLAAIAAGPVAELDPRIAGLVRRLRADLPARLDLAQVAQQLGLSESRLMHLFKAQIGVPLRRFVLALRLQKAVNLWSEDMNLTELAVEAGFYDQPHLIRTAREMVDELPSLLTDPRRVRVVRCY